MKNYKIAVAGTGYVGLSIATLLSQNHQVTAVDIIPEKVDFFDALPDYDGALFTNKKSKTDPEVARAMLEAAIPALEGLDGWTTEGIHDALIALAEKLAVKNATLMWPVRIAAAGKAVTPGGAVEICHVLGREETLRRLRRAIEVLK